MKNILVISIILIFNTSIKAQCVGSSFQRVYGGSGNDRGHSIINTSDGGYAVVGETNSFGAGGNDFFILKLDVDGTEEWTKTYGGSSNDDGSNIGIMQSSDGGYMVYGYTESFGAGSSFDSYVLKLNILGNIQWEKRVNGAESEALRDVWEMPNGDFVFVGNSNSLSAGTDHDYHVIKMNSVGNIVWSKTYGGIGYDQAVGMAVDAGGSIYVSGVTDSYGMGTLEGFIIKLDGNGLVIWQKSVGGSSFDGLYNTIILNDGNILTTCLTEFSSGARDVLVVKLNATTGNLIWAKAYGGVQEDYGINLKQKSNNEIIVSANTLSFGSGQEMLLFSIDSVGSVNWAKIYGGGLTDEFERWGLPMVLTPDGGIIFAGTTENFGAIGQDVYVVKTNSCGESFCNEQNVSLLTITPSTAVLNTNVSVLNGLSLLNTNTLTSNITYNTIALCDSNLVSINKTERIDDDLSIYPNPVSDVLTIKSKRQIIEVLLFNSYGQVVIRKKTYNKTIIKFDVFDLKSGVYFLKARSKEVVTNFKINIIH